MVEAQQSENSGQVFRFHHSEALLRNVMENAAVGMLLIGIEGHVLYANRAFGQMLGYEATEYAGLDMARIVHPDSLSSADGQSTALLEGKIEGYRAERKYLRKDGCPIWVSVSVSLLRSERTGRPMYMVLQIIDIDRQKRAEEALAESESRWSSALEGAGQGVWDHDIRNNKVFYSRMWKIMRGFDPDEEIRGDQASWLERVHPDDRERILSTIRKQDSGEIPRNAFEYRERHQAGHWIWILSRGRPIDWFPDGSVARTVGTDTDITSLKRAEAALAEERERLKVTLESISDGVISTDRAGRIRFMNATAEQMTGWTSSEAVGRSVDQAFNIIQDGMESVAVNPVAECLARELVCHSGDDFVLLGRSGERRDVRASAAPVRTPHGAIIGAVLVFQDITQSRTLQRELAHSATHDSLTGLPNRLAFERALHKCVEQARREHCGHVLCFVDLDRFKAVNDNAGHAAGDLLLRKVAETIRLGCRTHDFAGRIGGDEFALILTDCPLAGAERVAEKVVGAISGLSFIWEDQNYQIGASVGLTPITADSPRADALMAEADHACYAAKSLGGNQTAVHRDENRVAVSA
jgi:diguanylate cyclase (GGDEF)-like protein/PAS domain S-box-containing protein